MARYGGHDVNADRFVWVCDNCPNEAHPDALYCDDCEAELEAQEADRDAMLERFDYVDRVPDWY